MQLKIIIIIIIIIIIYRVERGIWDIISPCYLWRHTAQTLEGLRYAVFTKNYGETVLFKIMKELAPLSYDTENAAFPNSFV